MPEMPEGLIEAWRVVHPDFRSSNGYRWPFPGHWAEAPGPCLKGGACPSKIGDGLCLAKTFRGAASGSIPAHTKLIVGYDPADLLGEDENKLRVKRAFVVDVVDVQREIREGAHANLRGANLRGADLGDADLGDADLRGANLRGAYLRYANLRDANLRDANLGYAYLRDANLRGAYLRYANLRDAYSNSRTVWPDRFDVAKAGVHVA